MPSLQLINSHLVIDINKGRVVFILMLSQAGPSFAMKTLEMLSFLLPLVSKVTGTIYQLVFRTMEFKQYN